MKLSQAGEKKLIEVARKVFRKGPRVRIGIGDDAAVLDLDGVGLVATTDMLVLSTHFPPGATPEDMARKAVVTNLSDLAAMGAEPLGLLFSVALPRRRDMAFVKRMMLEMDSVAKEYGTYVVGGDLDENDEIIIAGVALGQVKKWKPLARAGAKAGDLVAVTGNIGSASAGLKILMGKLPRGRFKALVDAQLRPVARVREGLALAKSGAVTSAIDITDGLAANLWQLARESGVRIEIEREKIPEDPLVSRLCYQRGFRLDDFVLYGGEDFELLFTVRPGGWRKVSNAMRRLGTKATLIGRVSGGEGVFVFENWRKKQLPDRGYEHFR
ncbi:MAG: thiamine-phosphate kinase [Candidatus Hadarchaeota archaeon]